MEPIAKTLSTYRPESSLTLAKPLPLSAVQQVFDSLKGQLGAQKLGAMWEGVPVNVIEREWSEGLAGYRRVELERGLAAVSDRVFPPTLGEFKNLCRPCLNPEWAWLEAQDGLKARDEGYPGGWTHSAVFFAAIKMAPAVRGGDWVRHRTAWTRVLGLELARGWREVPAPAMRVDHDVKVGPPPEHIAELLAQQRREIRKDIERKAFDEVLKEKHETQVDEAAAAPRGAVLPARGDGAHG